MNFDGPLGRSSGYYFKKICGKLVPKYAPSMSNYFYLGIYTSWHLEQYTLTLDVDNSSETPIGNTLCLSQRTFGQ